MSDQARLELHRIVSMSLGALLTVVVNRTKSIAGTTRAFRSFCPIHLDGY